MATPAAPSYRTQAVYDHPSYTTRQSLQFGKITGNAATGKFLAFANMIGYQLQVLVDTLGTSTFSSTKSANSVQLTIVINTDTTGTSPALSTATWGPYVAGGNNVSTSTGTAAIGAITYINLNTSTGTGGFGGYYIPQGSEIIVTLGTDATAVVVAALDYTLAPLAPVTA
jgi:hypothetical protein